MIRIPSGILVLLITGSTLFAQVPTWEHQAPRPYPWELKDIAMVSATEAWAVGIEGAVLHTTDAGFNWTRINLNTDSLNEVFFLDVQHGWAVGNGIFYTHDGGQTWQQGTGFLGSLYSLYFIDEMTGWAAGSGAVCRTTDGGATWDWVSLPSIWAVQGLFFHDALNGWCGNIDGELYRTTNGGRTWELDFTTASTGIMTIWFADEQEGWLIGYFGTYHTTDGGRFWLWESLPEGTWIYEADFVDRLNAWGVGFAMNIVHTDDGWETAATQRSPGGGPYLWGVSFADLNHGMAVGEEGMIVYTADGGENWVERKTGPSGSRYHDLHANDPANAWVTGDRGEIAWTGDGGAFWHRVFVDGFNELEYSNINGIAFLDDNLTGWACGVASQFYGDAAMISKSMDGGRTWQQQFFHPEAVFHDIVAIDPQTAIAAGTRYLYGGLIYRTTNGGATWTDVAPSLALFTSMDFVDEMRGWVCGGLIYRTDDGGVTWTQQYTPTYVLEDISFSDPQNGWSVGWFGTLLRTTNGGATWTPLNSFTIDHILFGVDAITDDVAWVVGRNDSQEFVARTTDGGQTWQQEPIPTDIAEWYDVTFLDEDYGWITGATFPPGGGVWHRTDGPPPGFTLLHDRVIRGRPIELRVTGAEPGTDVWFLYSLSGIGEGPCPDVIGGLCLDLLSPIEVLGSAIADGSGTAILTVNVPGPAPIREVHIQAVGEQGASWIKTNTTSSLIEPQ